MKLLLFFQTPRLGGPRTLLLRLPYLSEYVPNFRRRKFAFILFHLLHYVQSSVRTLLPGIHYEDVEVGFVGVFLRHYGHVPWFQYNLDIGTPGYDMVIHWDNFTDSIEICNIQNVQFVDFLIKSFENIADLLLNINNILTSIYT